MSKIGNPHQESQEPTGWQPVLTAAAVVTPDNESIYELGLERARVQMGMIG